MKKRRIITGGIILLVIFFLVFLYFKSQPVLLETDALFLKLSLIQGENAESMIGITNRYSQALDISLATEGISASHGLPLTLEPGEEKHEHIIFTTRDLSEGVYLGRIILSGFSGTKSSELVIPVIIEIQSSEVLFDSNLRFFPNQYSFQPGDSLSPEIKIFDLANTGKSTIQLLTAVKDFEGNVVFEDSETVVVNGSLDYSRSFTLPDHLREGMYVFTTSLKYMGSFGTSSTLFSVKKNSFFDVPDNLFLYFVALMSFIFVSFLIFFLYSLFHRDVLLEELKKQYQKELKLQTARLRKKEKTDVEKIPPEKKSEYIKDFEIVKQKRLTKLKKMYNQRIEQFSALKKKEDNAVLQKQVEIWKKQGYDTHFLEQNYVLPQAINYHQKIKEWKNKGYNTGILEKRTKKRK